jgi:type I restriction enzyme S subunit
MALTKYKIGELVQLIDERNNIGLRNFYGINIDKEFMPTVASTDLLDETKYKVVRKNRFVYSGMQTGRDKCIRIGLYSNDTPIIVSPAYITFEIKATDIIIPQYFFMLFLSKEKDRLGWFYSDGSIRSNLDWDVFCDIELKLPPIETQQKYVDIYNAIAANQKAYEKGLDDLKLVCDGFIEDLRHKMPCEKIGKFINKIDNRNFECISYPNKAVSIEKVFIDSHAVLDGVDISNYLIVRNNEFAYNTVTTKNGNKISIAINHEDTCLVSPIYTVFSVDTNKILSEYLLLWFKRSEFDRYARYNSWGSAREMFTFDDMCEVKMPIPNIDLQRSIAYIYTVYMQRREINEKLKAQIKDLCPILIKGSLKEA